MNDIAFVCVAFGKAYVDQQDRLKQSLKEIYPDNYNLFFWTDILPPGSVPFPKSLYGFKPHAVEYARAKGFRRIAFFDPACIVKKHLDYYQDIVNDYGVIAVQDDNLLPQYCYKKATDHFKLSRHEILKWHLVGGSFYYFDFNLQLCCDIFDKWMNAERLGLFGSQQDQARGQLHGHRSDEAIMSLALYSSGSKPLYEDTRYRCDDCIIDKKHFK